jgi:hypothetical protein
MGDETIGIHALYEGANNFELIFSAYNVTDIVIDSNDDIYATANEYVARSFDNGQSFEILNEGLSGNLKTLHISANNFLFATRHDILVKSRTSIFTSIGDNKALDVSVQIKLSPNPVQNVLNVQLISELKFESFCTVCVYDNFGRLVQKSETAILGNSLQVDISNYAAGLYSIVLIKHNKILTSKFIKM